MDPTLTYTRRYNSFTQERPVAESPLSYAYTDDGPSLTQGLLVDLNLYNTLNNAKDELGDLPDLSHIRLQANPYEDVGRSIFMDRAGVKMANIDAVFNLTKQEGGYLAQQTAGRFVFCDLAGAPGAWSQYVQWRRPESYGYGISLREGIDWNLTKLNADNMTISFGSDNTGDLYKNAIFFSDEVLRANPLGADLIIADGGFNVDTRELEQEILTFNLILSECLVGVRTCRLGGSFVVKVYDTVQPKTASLIYSLSKAFDEICLFKPVTSRPANSERYLVCIRRNETPIDELTHVYESIDVENGTSAEFDSINSVSFAGYLTRMNNFHAQEQLVASKRIIDLAAGRTIPDMQVDSYLCTGLFMIPGSHSRRS